MEPHGKAVFISYASQDGEAVKRICETLRAGGIEVWFDQAELVGGDAWDRKIRRQIKECALFMPVVSQNTQARLEGYFRLEWKLAAERTHTMAEAKPFLLPVVIDGTADGEAHVPEEFLRVQWTRLPGGETTAGFCQRVQALLAGTGSVGRGQWSVGSGVPWSEGSRFEPKQAASSRGEPGGGPPSPGYGAANKRRLYLGYAAIAVCALLVGAYFIFGRSSAAKSEVQKLIDQMGVVYELQEDATRDDWEQGEKLGKAATDQEPLNAEAWAAYAQMALGLGDYYFDRTRAPVEDGLKRAQTAVRLQATSFEARFALASAYRRRGQTVAEAEEKLRELLKEKPDPRVMRSLAFIVANAGRQAKQGANADPARAAQLDREALALFDRANATKPGGDFVALRRKALMLEALGRFAEADAELDKSIALHNGPGVTAQKIASRLTLHDDLPGAVAILQRMPGSFLQHEDLVDWASRVWLWQGNATECQKALRNWQEFVVGTPMRFVLGQAYQLAGGTEAARNEWRKALAAVDGELKSPGLTITAEMTYVYWRGRLLALLEDRAEAEASLRDFEQRTANIGLAGRGFMWATLLSAVGRNEDALRQFDAALGSLDSLGTPNPTIVRREGVLWVATIRHDPAFAGLRALPGYAGLEGKMGRLSVLNPK